MYLFVVSTVQHITGTNDIWGACEKLLSQFHEENNEINIIKGNKWNRIQVQGII